MDIKDFRGLPSSAQEDMRRKAANAVFGGGGRCSVAKLFAQHDRRSASGRRFTKRAEKRSSSIRLFFLPKYSPDLNPDEYLNNDVKSNAVDRRRAKDKDDLKANVPACPRSAQRQPNIDENFFQERHAQ
jgi:hypothetical protein